MSSFPVLLPYRFTLFSNVYAANCSFEWFYYLIDLHYSQTSEGGHELHTVFYYLIDLHYSQTGRNRNLRFAPFYYLIDLHYSQTTDAL